MLTKLKQAIISSLIAISFLFVAVPTVQADDLVVNCPDSSADIGEDATADCLFQNSGTTQSAQPLFHIDNLAPGQSHTQVLTVNNLDTNETCDLEMTVVDQSESGNLASVLDTNIYSSQTVWFSDFLQNLFNQGRLALGQINPESSQTFTWSLNLDGASVGNDFQGLTTTFNFSVSFTCQNPSLSPTLTPVPTTEPTEDGDGSDDTTSNVANTDPAEPPSCDIPDEFSTAPTSFTAVGGTNSVSLNWDAYDSAGEYAIFFYNQAGDEYSVAGLDTNLNTNYTISNLSAGTWTFELIAAGGEENLCTSPRTSTSAQVGGGAVEGEPEAPGEEEVEQVLGVQDDQEESTPSGEQAEAGQPRDKVAGAQTSCPVWQNMILWILLFVQFLGLLTVEIVKRKDHSAVKYVWQLGITVLSIIAFYIFSDCNCYGDQSLAAVLCRWYWLVSILETGLMRMIGYGFIEVPEEAD